MLVKAEERVDFITNRLNEVFAPTQLEVIDDAQHHTGHAGAEGGAGHFTVKMASEQFEHQSSVACHRLIYQALDDLMKADIHALKIKILN